MDAQYTSLGIEAWYDVLQVAALSEKLFAWMEDELPSQQASMLDLEQYCGASATSSELAAALTLLQEDDQIYLKTGLYHVM